MNGHLRRRTGGGGGRHIDQGSMSGFNGLTFGSGGGSDLAFVYNDPVDQLGGPSDEGRGGSQLAALQREVAVLRQQNRALVTANNARQQAAVS
ncbi:hypothetical protein H4S07_006836, partial [Coemansia furcata]